MISAYNSAVTALNAFGTKVQSNGNNIANANTNEFKRTRVTNSTTETQGVKPVVEKVNTPGPLAYEETGEGSELVELSNVDLATEITDMNLNSHFYKANLKTIQTVDEMTGDLLNIKS